MGSDQPVACIGVRRGEYRLDFRDGHLEAPQAADDLGHRDLILGVVAISVGGVDLAGLEQPDLVVVAQRLDAQVRRARELADRDVGSHAGSIDSPGAGGSRRKRLLDPPVTGGRNLHAATALAALETTTRETLMSATTALNGIVAEHVDAINAHDEDAIVATFADDAFVNDIHREFWGADAIRRWVAKEIVGDRVTVEPIELIEHDRQTIVRGPVRRRVRQDRLARPADPDQLLHGPQRKDRQPDRDPQHPRLLTATGKTRHEHACRERVLRPAWTRRRRRQAAD